MPSPPPRKILIIGSGVFGLSTALSLARSPAYNTTTTTTSTSITLIDRSPFPAPDASSIDTSRIIRADYDDPAYAALASKAQALWRLHSLPGDADTDAEEALGGDGRYVESGLVLVAEKGGSGEGYVRGSFENVKRIIKEEKEAGGGGGKGEGQIRELDGAEQIRGEVGTGGGSGDWGYLNKGSGWADAEGGMRWLGRRVEETGRVTFLCAEVAELVREEDGENNDNNNKKKKKVVGVRLQDGTVIDADLVIVAAGAWSGKLVDLRGRATATGQVLMYVDLTQAEQDVLGKMPVLLNMSTGLFIIPPRNRLLKVARHAYGYSNPTLISDPDDDGGGSSGQRMIEVSLPRTHVDDPTQWVPREGEEACRAALREMIPSLGERPWSKARICWYTDTPNGDFLITYHPEVDGLFLATGGSGHGYKFLPVIGDKIVECIRGHPPEEFRDKWKWPREKVDKVVTEDGSRGGRPGLILEEEFGKGGKKAL